MTYTYRGNYQGPDLFDVPHKKGESGRFPYEAMLRDEKSAKIAHCYAGGLHDHEIAQEVGCSPNLVQKWREERGLQSNWDLLVKF